jgi:ABC-type transport system involved in cytochrome c biogenesis ATPase subunit
MITKQETASKIMAYLKHQIGLSQLVSWAENVIAEEELKKGEELVLMEVLSLLGLADVKSFGLNWEDCESIMNKLGYKIRVEAALAS